MFPFTRISKETATKVYGSVWLADDFGGNIVEHLGLRRPALHIGEVFPSLETAKSLRPGYAVSELSPIIRVPTVMPIPLPRKPESSSNPREIYVVEFDKLMTLGIRVFRKNIVAVDFEIPPSNLMGEVDFVPGAVIAGDDQECKVYVSYADDGALMITENPYFRARYAYAKSLQANAFFTYAEAEREADDIAAALYKAAAWRQRRD